MIDDPRPPYRDDFADVRHADMMRRRRRTFVLAALLVVVALGAVGLVALRDPIEELLGTSSAADYDGDGNGQEILVTIEPGDTGADVARRLHDAGVTKSFDAVYDRLLAAEDVPNFVPGTFRLQGEMSATAALAALADPANVATNRALLREGISAEAALVVISESSDIPLADLQAVAADPASLGVPAGAPSIEGFLFPATYDLPPGTTARDALQMMVDEMATRLRNAGVAEADWLEVVTLASIIQREAGPNPDDFPKVSRVFLNRLDAGWKLESDATVSYGTGRTDSVYTTAAERADASNRYNTYANPGLPVGPIGLPGDQAIAAAIAPAEGPWFFFVPINLATGETVFSETLAEHNAGVAQLRAWCRESEENDAYCQ